VDEVEVEGFPCAHKFVPDRTLDREGLPSGVAPYIASKHPMRFWDERGPLYTWTESRDHEKSCKGRIEGNRSQNSQSMDTQS
jgi:hypothetical protein